MERRAEQTAFRSDEATETEFQLLEQTYRDLGSQFLEQLRKTTISKLLMKK